MSNGNLKKWLTVVRIDQYVWLKDMAQKNGLSGSDILVTALDHFMNNKAAVDALAETRLKLQLQKLNDEAAAIEEKREQVRRSYKELTGKERIMAKV